jgi:hypothetical protein
MPGVLFLASLLMSQLACVRALVPSPLSQEATLGADSAASGGPRDPLQGGPDATYGVVWIGEGGVLAVRQIAGGGALALEELSPDATGIQLTGNSSLLGSSLWVEVLTPAGTVGWVNASNLTEIVPQGTICNDGRARKLVDDLEAAVRAGDMSALAGLLSERRGLNVRLSPHGTTVTIPQSDVPQLLQAPATQDWGPASETGAAVVGTFAEAVLPRLESVFGQEVQVACDELLQGQTAWPPVMPMELRNMEFFSAHVPAQASAAGMDWQTWVMAVEYVGGEPRIGALVRFQGEI